MAKFSVIITAGGIGTRIGSRIPKQFIPLNDKPILMYTIERFYHYDPHIQIIVTLPSDWHSYWEELLIENDFRIPHRVVSGGKERYHSIKNALEHCIGTYIAVHDGVRPLVSSNTLSRCFKEVQRSQAVIPVMDLKESLRIKEGDDSRAVNRSDYLLVQTPQCFEREILINAYNLPFDDTVTDDATIVERTGIKISMVEGNENNMKITTQSDLSVAEFLLK